MVSPFRCVCYQFHLSLALLWSVCKTYTVDYKSQYCCWCRRTGTAGFLEFEYGFTRLRLIKISNWYLDEWFLSIYWRTMVLLSYFGDWQKWGVNKVWETTKIHSKIQNALLLNPSNELKQFYVLIPLRDRYCFNSSDIVLFSFSWSLATSFDIQKHPCTVKFWVIHAVSFSSRCFVLPAKQTGYLDELVGGVW